jgi:DNA replication protein DnaC
MQSLIKTLRTEETDRHAGVKMRRIRASNPLIIDEEGYLPINATEGNMFFQLISELHERTAIIITTNKGFEEWTEFLGDAALATAILDRLAYQCDKIPMNGKSYSLENRKTFLEETA